MNKHELGVRTARQLRSAEHQFDEALAEAFGIGQSLISSRASAGFSLAVGQDALAKLSKGIGLMVKARAAIGQAHEELADTASDHGVRWRLEGPDEEKPIKPDAMLKAVA